MAQGPIVHLSTSISSLLVFLLSGNSWFGLPPGPRDVGYVRCPEAQVVYYSEWAPRTSGILGKPGIEGLIADPEIQTFLKDAKHAFVLAMEERFAQGPESARIISRSLPPLLADLAQCSGCFYVGPELKSDTAQKPANSAEGPEGAIFHIRGTLIFDGGAQSQDIARRIGELLLLLPAEHRRSDLQRQAIPLPAGAPELILHRHNNYFILGYGQGAVDQAVAGLSGKSQGLSENARFLQATKHVTTPSTASVTWIDLHRLVEMIGESIGPKALQMRAVIGLVGADAMDSLVSETGIVDGRVVVRSFVTTGGRTAGILALAAGRPMTAADLARVPADSDLVVAASVDGSKVLDAVRAIVVSSNPASGEQFDAHLSELEQKLKLSIRDDLFKAFGDVCVFHDSPSGGGFFLTSIVGSLELRDAEKAVNAFPKLMALLENSLPREIESDSGRRQRVTLAKKEFMGRTIYYINSVGKDSPFAPAFCLTDKELLAAIHPQALKAHLRFLSGTEGNFSSRLGKEVPLPEGELLCVTHVATAEMLKLAYAFAPFVGQVLADQMQASGGQIDIFSLPSARAIFPYVQNSHSTVVRRSDGLYFESANGL